MMIIALSPPPPPRPPYPPTHPPTHTHPYLHPRSAPPAVVEKEKKKKQPQGKQPTNSSSSSSSKPTTTKPAAVPATAPAAAATPAPAEAAPSAPKKKNKKKAKGKGGGTAAAASGPPPAQGGGGDDSAEDSEEDEVDVRLITKKGAAAAGGGGGQASKAAKKGAPAVVVAMTEDETKLDPVALCIKECVRRGHNQAAVEAMVNAMWDQSKDYGSPDAVEEELNLVKAIKAIDDKPGSSSPAKASSSKAAKKAEKKAQQDAAAIVPKETTPTPAAPAPVAPAASQKKNNDKSTPAPTKTEATAPAPKAVSSPPPAPTTKAAALVAKAQPLSRANLLELAASKEDTSIVDKLSAVAGFLLRPDTTAEDRQALLSSKALELLFQGVVKACLDAPSYPSDPALTEALSSLLRVLVGSAAALDDLKAILAHAQGLHAKRPLSAEVVGVLAQTLAGSVKEFYVKKEGTAKTWKDLASLEGSLKTAGAAVGGGAGGKAPRKGGAESTRELFELRDKHAQLMDLQQQACRLLVETTSTAKLTTKGPPPGPVGSKTAAAKNEEALVDAVLKDSLGLSSQAQLSQKRREIAAAKHDLSAVHSALEVELGPLVAEVGQAKETLQGLRVQREALAQELAAIEAKVASATAVLTQKEGQVAVRRAALEKTASEKDRRLQGMLADVRRADEADELVAKVHTWTASLAGALSTALVADTDKHQTQLRKRVRAFGAAFEPYLVVEARCVEFLRGRVAGLEKERVTTLAKLNEFQSMNMGLESNIQELVKKAADQQAFIEQDNALLAHLVGATNALYLTFREAVEQTGGPGAKWIVTDAAGLSLVSIKQHLDRMGLAHDWLPGLSSTPAPPASSSSSSSSSTPPPTHLLSSPLTFSPAPAAPVPASTIPPPSSPPGLSKPPQAPSQFPSSSSSSSSSAQATRPPRNPPTASMPSPPPPVQQAPAIKFSWANRAPASSSSSPVPPISSSSPSSSPLPSPQPHKSLVQIQEEERQVR